MSGRIAVRIVELIIAVVIVAIALISIRVKTGKPWSVILKGPDRLSRPVKIVTFFILLLIFAVFFIVNNEFFE